MVSDRLPETAPAWIGKGQNEGLEAVKREIEEKIRGHEG
jgi:hypothetical protein